MDHRGSVYFSVLFIMLIGVTLLIGTSLSVHQLNQRKMVHGVLAWQGLFLAKSMLDRWQIGLSPEEDVGSDFIVNRNETTVYGGIGSSELIVAWKEEGQLKKISLIAYKPVIP